MPDETRTDDLTIENSDRLFRRVPRNQTVRLADGSYRPASSAFKNSELSVYIESLMFEQGRKSSEALRGYDNTALTSIAAGAVRKQGPQYPIIKDNGPEHDPAHGLVLGKKTDSFANAMVRAHVWIIAPEPE